MGLLLSYGAARTGASLCKELQTAVFAKVSATAIREVGSNTFRHVLDLDLKFHLTRETGALTRYLDRGGRCAPNYAVVLEETDQTGGNRVWSV